MRVTAVNRCQLNITLLWRHFVKLESFKKRLLNHFGRFWNGESQIIDASFFSKEPVRLKSEIVKPLWLGLISTILELQSGSKGVFGEIASEKLVESTLGKNYPCVDLIHLAPCSTQTDLMYFENLAKFEQQNLYNIVS